MDAVERNLTYGRSMFAQFKRFTPKFVEIPKGSSDPVPSYEVTCSWCKEGQGHYKPVRSHTLCKRCEIGLFERDTTA